MGIDGIYLIVGALIGLVLGRVNPMKPMRVALVLAVVGLAFALVLVLRNVYGMTNAGDLILGLAIGVIFLRGSRGREEKR